MRWGTAKTALATCVRRIRFSSSTVHRTSSRCSASTKLAGGGGGGGGGGGC
jgi:hypothetical protein